MQPQLHMALEGGCISQGPSDKQNYYGVCVCVCVCVCIYKELYYKELAHLIMEAENSEICK